MPERTCAACDATLEEPVVRVTIGGHTVEVCCEPCAVKLKEAHRSATMQIQTASGRIS